MFIFIRRKTPDINPLPKETRQSTSP